MVSYERFQKRLALRQYGMGCNPRFIDNLMREYDKQSVNPRTQEKPTALSEYTEYILVMGKEHGIKTNIPHNKHIPNFPRVKRTFNQLKPHGWASEWGFGHQTKRQDIYVMRHLQKQKSTTIATYTREQWEKIRRGEQ